MVLAQLAMATKANLEYMYLHTPMYWEGSCQWHYQRMEFACRTLKGFLDSDSLVDRYDCDGDRIEPA